MATNLALDPELIQTSSDPEVRALREALEGGDTVLEFPSAMAVGN